MESQVNSGSTECFNSVEELNTNHKIKSKRSSVLGRIRGFLSTKKKRSKNQDNREGVSEDESAGEGEWQQSAHIDQSHSSHSMPVDVDSTFSPDNHSLPKSGLIGMRQSSASMEVLSTTGPNFKSELERKLINRRSLDDDGLPGSPIGTPTASEVISQPHFLGQESYKADRDSDGSLLSIGSSENDEDAFFTGPWKGAQTSAIRRPQRGTLSSDSEPEDALDLDAVARTTNLSNSAAMHKRSVRPKHRAKSRRVIAAPVQMPSVAEKKTLEIAHSFLDDGETTPAVKLRNTESAVHNAASVRRTDSGRTFSSPTALKRSDTTSQEPPAKPLRPVTRSVTTNSHATPRHQGGDDGKQNELFSVLKKFKPVEPHDSSSPPLPPKPSATDSSKEEQPPPRPAKIVEFSKTPPLQRRNKSPAVQPRPKSMFPQHRPVKIQELSAPDTTDSGNKLSYSKSFNAAETGKSHDQGKPLPHEDDKTSSLPDWAKLAKRKTRVDKEPTPSAPEVHASSSKQQLNSKPVPAARAGVRGVSNEQGSELDRKFNQIQQKSNNVSSADSDVAHDASYRKVPSPLEDRPLLYSPSTSGSQATRSDSAKTGNTGSTSYGFYAEKLSPGSEEKDVPKETIIVTKSKPLPAPRTSDTTSSSMNEPSWRASLKPSRGSIKIAPTTDTETAVVSKPAWKSATQREKKTPALLSSSTENLQESALHQSRVKSKTLDFPGRRQPNPMTVSESSAFTAPSPDEDETEENKPKKFKDRLKMFQNKGSN